MTISRERHKSGVAAIRMQLLDSDQLCGGGGGVGGGGQRRKEIEFTIEPSLSRDEFREAVGWVIGIIVATYAMVGVIIGFLYRDAQKVCLRFRELDLLSRMRNHATLGPPF